MIQTLSRGLILAVGLVFFARAQAQQYAALRDGRPHRQGGPRGQRRHPGASGLADQDDDALHRLRRGAARPAVARPEGDGLGQRRRRAAVAARAEGRAEDRAALPDPRGGDQVGQRRGHRARRGGGRLRGGLRRADEPVCPRHGHDEHQLQERQRPDRDRAHVHRARHGDRSAGGWSTTSRSTTTSSAATRPRPASPRCRTPTAGCSTPIPAPTASRPATPGRRGSTSSPRRSAATSG